jgi:cytochrome c-type biogenesis protein CcmE
MVVIVAAVAYLLLSGTTASAVYFLTVPEVQQQLSALQQASHPIRVAGQVTADPIYWEVRQLSLAFHIGEGEARLPVQYTGVKPDMFQAGASVIVEGRIGRDGVLHASTVMTSCPSKYQDEKHASS